MNEQQTEVQAGPVVKVARDLTEIVKLYDDLHDQALATGDHPSIPGGPALMAIGKSANIEAWENMQQAHERHADHPDERLRRAYTSVADEDPDEAWSAYQLLEFWAEQWRAIHEAEYDMHTNIAVQANFIRACLDWAWDNEPHWDDFAGDVNRARVRLEDIVHAGRRVDRTRIICSECDEAPRLIRIHGRREDQADDAWKCPACKHRFDVEGVSRAHARMLRSQDAERWVQQIDAIGILKAQGRPERTVRQWLADGEGSGYCDPVTHTVWVWWPDLWHKHLTTPTRRRPSA